MPGRPERGEQVPGQQALGRGLVVGEAEREQHAVLHQGVRSAQRGERGRGAGGEVSAAGGRAPTTPTPEPPPAATTRPPPSSPHVPATFAAGTGTASHAV